MNLFIANIGDDGSFFLDEDETFHCIKSLRHQVGDTIHVTTGDGCVWTALIMSHTKKRTVLKCKNSSVTTPCPYSLHIAVAPTKNRSRIEQFIEKAVEVGIQKITFIQCQRSEKKKINLERMNKIARSATKQSLKTYFTSIEDLTRFEDFVDNCTSAQKYIAHCNTSIEHRMTNYDAFDDCTILIGPEGDFSKDEIQYAIQHGFKELNLGDERLRTETAALFATFFVNIAHK